MLEVECDRLIWGNLQQIDGREIGSKLTRFPKGALDNTLGAISQLDLQSAEEVKISFLFEHIFDDGRVAVDDAFDSPFFSFPFEHLDVWIGGINDMGDNAMECETTGLFIAVTIQT